MEMMAHNEPATVWGGCERVFDIGWPITKWLLSHSSPGHGVCVSVSTFFSSMRVCGCVTMPGVTIPSQQRYVHYYDTKLHSGMPPAITLRLLSLRLSSIPSFKGQVIHTHIYTHIYTHTHTHIHTCTYTHVVCV